MLQKSKFSKKDQGNIWLWIVAGGGSIDDLVKVFGVKRAILKAEVMRQIKILKKRGS